jgi:glyoxylase-like metal-dependent hydrolase (beta-lactamase superfamily II)
MAAAALLPRSAFAKSVAAPPITFTHLADDLWLFQGSGGNVLVAGGKDGLLLVDGGAPERADELFKSIREATGGHRIGAMLNTHWHWDHTGLNEIAGKAGAPILAHENTKLWLGAEVNSKWEGRVYAPRPARALPTKTFFYGTRKLTFGKRTIEYGHLPQAHTDGDIYVLFPDENLIDAGGVVSGGSYPIADYCTNGWLGGMMSALQTLIKMADAKTRFVSGRGPIRTKGDLQDQLELCHAVLKRIGDNYYKGETWKQLLDSRPTREFDAKWGDPTVFLKTAYEGAWLHVNEIRRVTL